MNNQEFQLWWDHAVVVIPTLADWLGKIKKHPDKDWKKVLRFWSDRMSRVSLVEAKDAIEKIAQDSPPKFNRDYEAIPFAIAHITSTPSTMSPGTRHYVDGVETVKCLTCKDEGFITIWDGVCVTAMRNGDFENKYPYTAAVRCTCEAGHRKTKDITMFDPSLHCRAVDTRDEGVEALREFCNPHNRAKAMGNYNASLAEF